jgi:hypothetical protein
LKEIIYIRVIKNNIGNEGIMEEIKVFFSLEKWYNIVNKIPPITNCIKYS